MSDLQTLLEHAVDHRVDLDPEADLRRGRAALRRRRRVVGGGIAAAVLVAGSTTWVGLSRSAEPPTGPSHSTTVTVHAGAFEVPPPPAGWSVWRASPSYVVIAPDGTPPPKPGGPIVVTGRLLVHLQRYSFPSRHSTPIERGGRTFYDYTGGGGHQIGVREPNGTWLVLQPAWRLHWTPAQMVDYLNGVVVLPEAVPESS